MRWAGGNWQLEQTYILPPKAVFHSSNGTLIVYQEKKTEPERRFAVLSFPVDCIEDTKDAVLLPVLIQKTIQYGIR